MFKQWGFKALAMATILVSSACSGGGGGGDVPQVVVPPPSPPPASNMTYHVHPTGSDANDGSSAAPFATIQVGIDIAEPGDTVRVSAGVYKQRVVFQGGADSGAEGEPMILRAEAGAIISGDGLTPTGREGLITLSDVSHVMVTGFEIRDFATVVAMNLDDTPIGILVDGDGENIELAGNVVHAIANRSTCQQGDANCFPGANGIGIYGTGSAGLRDIRVLDNEVYENQLASSEALTLNGNVSGFMVSGNSVHDNDNIGFDFIGLEADTCSACTDEQNRARNGIVRNNTAENNTITTNPWYSGQDGNAAGFYVDGGEYILLEQNVSTGNDLGFEIASEAPNGVSSHVLIASNLIYQNRELGIAVGGYSENQNQFGGGRVTDVYVVNNTLFQNKGWGTEIVLQYRVRDAVFQNNIVSGIGSVSESFEQAEGDIQSQRVTWKRNIWWGTGGSNMIPVDDPAGLIGDPLLSDPLNGAVELIVGSPARDSAEPVNDITDWLDPFWAAHFPAGIIPGAGSRDLAGGMREQGILDIGATEQ